MMGYGYGYGFSMFWMMLIVTAVLIIVSIALLKVFSHGYQGHPYKSGVGNALDILNERYAKGEISDEEFKSKKQLLIRR